ncbi:hypothetical protein G7058_11595 (plasmid) [Jeotgalibaca porci]|uniref:Uncharacterized protein n=1 Tax=Jeotgalibaca porci TaxID=1868793 RepID=A0A6G7WKJ2_9LACT|nr:hypothetical protein [Jeotgalibaca porci]QIK52766.1 hypothetical protein G7058_11595 [Jeotgalibaca porci]
MKRPRNDYVPNQGCGIFFLMVLSVIFLLSIPVFKFTHELFLYYTEKQILLISDSPEETYHIEVSTKGPSTTILIEEDTTSSELTADIVKDGQADVHSKDIEIQWLNDTVAEIMMEGRRDTFHYFLFDANAEEEKIERMPNGIERN